jgi:hypothetical protein
VKKSGQAAAMASSEASTAAVNGFYLGPDSRLEKNFFELATTLHHLVQRVDHQQRYV